jgi:hypothetical protein
MTNWKERIQNNYNRVGLQYKTDKLQWPKRKALSQMVKNINQGITKQIRKPDKHSISKQNFRFPFSDV